MIRQVHELEARFASLLREWGGDMDEIEVLRDYLVREWELPAREAPVLPPMAVR